MFGELVEGLSPLPISDIPEDPVVGTHYGRYGELEAGPRLTSDCDRYEKDALNVDENDDGGAADDGAADDGVADDGAADDGAADDGAADDGAADDNDDQEKNNDQNSDGDYTEEQGKPGRLGKGSSLDKTWSRTLVTPEKALLDTSEGVKPETVTSDAGKKLTR